MPRLKLVIGLALAAMPLQAAVYKWIDKQGLTHYSDRLQPGAEQVSIPMSQTEALASKTREPVEPIKKTSGLVYKQLKILQPLNKTTIRNNQGYLPVVVESFPALSQHHAFQLLLDGRPQGKPITKNVFSLHNLDRGTHHLSVQIIDSHGRVLAKSTDIECYIHRYKK